MTITGRRVPCVMSSIESGLDGRQPACGEGTLETAVRITFSYPRTADKSFVERVAVS
jgi:hypothetical protein